MSLQRHYSSLPILPHLTLHIAQIMHSANSVAHTLLGSITKRIPATAASCSLCPWHCEAGRQRTLCALAPVHIRDSTWGHCLAAAGSTRCCIVTPPLMHK